MFTAEPYRGNPVAVVLDADGLDDDDDAARRPLDQPVRDDVRPAADRARRRLPRAHLHAGGRAAVRRPPDARHVPRLARRRRHARRADDMVQECGAGLDPDPAGREPAGVRRSPAGALRPGRRPLVGRGRRRPRPRRARRSSPPSGSTTARAGWRCCSTAPTRCSPCGPASSTSTSASSASTRRARRGDRGAGLLPQGRHAGRGSGDRQPQRLGRASG